jgi:hypothetical protein
VIIIPLRDKHGMIVALTVFDDEDADQTDHRWYMVDGYVGRSVRVDGRRRSLRLHREILGLAVGDPRHTDHINRDPLDNRRANLRIVTAAQNNQNLGLRGGSSRYRGVSLFARTGRWRAECTLNGKNHHLGYFDSEDEAGEVARAFRAEHMPFSTEAVR